MSAFTSLTENFAVAPQLAPDDMAAVAAAGFKSVINNRPDFEGGPAQPSSEQMQAAAQAAGLSYVHQPVNGANIQPGDVATFASLLKTLPGPVLAFCRSGARSTKLFMSASSL
ncbi:TIGR01244 family sulfur transferase [Pigmentiphaga sp.]|uniref:TIGR01244 family sulfur transferase n=1 Tax=Pigmentiphaga sp. TaxID=1977564 RepID=UPI00128E6EAC|nr:TIGR01244 family sulfur transferase [Pigmentiphaga sp.]MPS29244.1 TIGR01244 family phosphatase [Alcaligenaceae bacterium SAGV5]MPS54764.1 TIGR01244 family phosphatase [Alcaligenaceae bacterium SAGV3]MPT58434.1 TIGR01244 family phosphatase [Alcaligenaceae bacterium]